MWSLVSAVGIFCLGAGLTCAHGLNALMAPPPHLDNLGYGLAGAPAGPAGALGDLPLLAHRTPAAARRAGGPESWRQCMRARLRLLVAAISNGRQPGGAAHVLRAHSPVSRPGAVRAVLGLSFVVEGYSLLVATRSVVAGAAAAGLGTMEFIKRGMDPTSIAVMLEDGAAVTGLVIAGAAVALGTWRLSGEEGGDGEPVQLEETLQASVLKLVLARSVPNAVRLPAD